MRSGTLSFEEVYDGYLDFVWRTSLRLGADTTVIDDVVQEVFLVVHQRLAEFEGRSSMRTWLFGIVRKVVGRVRRTARRKPSHVGTTEPTDLDVFTTAECGPGESAERAEELRLVQRLLDQLDDDKREAFVLAELEQMTIAEVAEAVGANPNTVASRIRAARAAFERGLEEWEASGGKP
ncbi:RNA polymerase sigma factor RpoE [Labilithrix luteola]|uniref:RNA polymerase sigma factor RpoE n=1 Tax=Labilithrix luteola TaxID=1391654 RepID=A0A0K1PYK5_9BACT|nr:RNA polymerase sigma factor RpoE [Labilithrix luteola]